MKSKSIPKRPAGKKADLGTRVVALLGSTLLITTAPACFIGAGLGRAVDYLTKIQPEESILHFLDEYMDATKTCLYTAFRGKYPEKA